MRIPYRAALRYREFRYLISGRFISQLGNQASVPVLGFAVLEIGGGAVDIGVVLGAEAAAVAVFLVVGGVVTDMWPRRKIMIAADLIRLGSQGLTATLLITGTAQLWHLVVLQVLAGAAAALYIPAVTAIGAEAVEPEHMQDANALRSLVIAVTTIAGPALGGLLAALVGPGEALALDALTFLVSAALVSRMSVGADPVRAGQNVLAQARAGWYEFSSRRWLWSVTCLGAVVSVCVLAPVIVLGPVISEEALGGVGPWATILSGLGVGSVAGGILISWVSPRRPLAWAVSVTVALLPLLALLAWPAPLWALVGAGVLMGFGQSVYYTLWQTALQQRVPADVLGRVSSYDWLGLYAFGPLGYLLVPVAALAFGNVAVMWTCAAVVLAMVCVVLSLPEVRHVADEDTLAERSGRTATTSEQGRQ